MPKLGRFIVLWRKLQHHNCSVRLNLLLFLSCSILPNFSMLCQLHAHARVIKIGKSSRIWFSTKESNSDFLQCVRMYQMTAKHNLIVNDTHNLGSTSRILFYLNIELILKIGLDLCKFLVISDII